MSPCYLLAAYTLVVRLLAAALLSVIAFQNRLVPARPTLGQTISDLGTDAAGLPDALLTQPITSFATLAGDGEFAVAYYDDDGSGRLPPPLHVAFRPRGGAWRMRDIAAPTDQDFGSVVEIVALPSHICIHTHLTPSAGRLVVLNRDLTVDTVLDGWIFKTLPDDLIVFERNMVHFAPAHPEALGVYDPRTHRATTLYPTAGGPATGLVDINPALHNDSPARRAFVDLLTPLMKTAASREASPYGWDPQWFDVTLSAESASYSASTDTLEFHAIFDMGRLPPDLQPAKKTVLVTCRPMRQPARTCAERAQ
jgi:hypothetical protein